MADDRTQRLLVVERDEAVRRLLVRRFEHEGFEVEAQTELGGAGWMQFGGRPDLVLLELRGSEGVSELLELRKVSDVPVIGLLWPDPYTDEPAILDLGADDCVTRPLSFRALVARTRAVLRRAAASDTRTLSLGDLEIDLAARSVSLGGDPVSLTPREFDLLAFLAAHPGEVFSRDQILTTVWRSSAEWQQRETVTEHIHRLRARLGDNPSQPRWLLTVRGVGYRLVVPEDAGTGATA